MKKICLVLAFVFLAAGAVAAQKTFYSKKSKVGFRYPSNLILRSGADSTVEAPGFTTVASVSFPGKAFPRTNFGEANAILAVASITEARCKRLPKDEAETSPIRRVKVGNNLFYRITGNEGAMGTFWETRLYRTFHNGSCYQVKTVVSFHNMGAYDKGAVKEVNINSVFYNLESTVRTLYF